VSLQEVVGRLNQARVLVVGDVMLDVYLFGRVTRISQEAPVPVFVEERRETRMGGAGNVAANLDALGGHTVTNWTPGVRTHKFRFFQGHHQLFRQDEDHQAVPQELEVARAASQIHGHGCNAVVLSDYAKGWCSPEMCQGIIAEAVLRGVPVIVDPKGTDWSKYAGASVLCPNEAEWTAVDMLIPAGARVVAKHGEKGIAVVELAPDGKSQLASLIPAHARHVYDVTGAGDTVTAVVAASLAVGATLVEAAYLANLAAGYVVGEIGTAVCPIEILKKLTGSA
jgi:rfaE bifunctional protein kinase chain/domain